VIIGLATVFVSTSYNLLNNSPVAGMPLTRFTQKIAKQRYKAEKGIRIYLRRNIPDKEGDSFLQDQTNIHGISGGSFTSKADQENVQEVDLLYPEKPGNLIPGSLIIIDIFVEDAKDKETIIQQAKKYPQVEVVANIQVQ
jgi:hypothetical protein